MNSKWKYHISIIVPVYNSEEYILESLKSMVTQDFSNYEIIIVDDGSTDDSIYIAKQYLENQEVPFVVVQQENRGLPAARNVGILTATGEYICFIDSDDIIERTHLQSLYSLAQKYHLPVVHCNFETTTVDNRYGSAIENKEGIILPVQKVIDYAMRRKPAVIVCGFLINKEFALNNDLIFNEKLRFGEDSDYIWKTIFACKYLGYTNKSTYKYCIHDNSIMRCIPKDNADLYIIEFTKTIQILKKHMLNDKKKIELLYYREIIGFLHAYAICTEKKDFKLILKKVNRKKLCSYLLVFPDIKIKILSMLLLFSPELFYTLFHK